MAAGPAKYVALDPVLDDVVVVLSALARTVGSSDDAVREAFDRGAARLPVATLPILVDAPPQRFVSAIGRIDEASGPVKARVMDALLACVHDPDGATPGVASADAMATLRAIGASLHWTIQ